MSEYAAPLRDMQFLLRELVDFSQLRGLSESLEGDLLAEVLEHAGTFSSEVLSPLNRIGDREGCRIANGSVVTPSGWRQAYGRFTADGWNGLSCPQRMGGQGYPAVVGAFAEEMWHGANAAFALCPMLTHSSIEGLELAGSPALKERFLPHLVSGDWSGTMALTEPQAGSDLAAIKTLAVPQPDGSYRISGQKIFITYGEHDLTNNIVHMVLARTPDAPPGVKGLSMFVVPKVLSATPGAAGRRNEVQCLSLEHKLGIHGSPTCVLEFGAGASVGATGWLVGDENRGLDYMFGIMNPARLSVGVQGLGIAERAYQQALSHARERRQGADTTGRASVPIIRHPDVRRMLFTMKAMTEAMRAVICVVAEAMDNARIHPQLDERERAQSFVSLMIPIIKGWCAESAVELASMNIQVHGGTGYIEESGAPQLLRDARIAPIYEGTTGIQANDLLNRKLLRDDGEAAMALVAQMVEVRRQLSYSRIETLRQLGRSLERAIGDLAETVQYVLAADRDRAHALAGAQPLLLLFGVVAGGWQLARSALAAERLQESGAERDFYEAKILTARFYGNHILPRAAALRCAAVDRADVLFSMTDEQF
jgi:alkylation response protein AidB-like acyl-CoA dehydrogenase